ncbi:MAG: hypothetical protein GY845_25735 [Planctomycetes bacterium]|nr:hypothetical protein [Planctomycetota bacterium]
MVKRSKITGCAECPYMRHPGRDYWECEYYANELRPNETGCIPFPDWCNLRKCGSMIFKFVEK